MPKGRVTISKSTLWKAIRKQCIECMGGQIGLIDGCTSPKCSLFSFRMGSDQHKYIEDYKNSANHSQKKVKTGVENEKLDI